jgi:DNA gyrase inhibitor GyrI
MNATEETTADLDVRIERLEPMRVATARAMSETPERDAWEKLRAWAEHKGLFDDMEKHPVYGFNNPNPTSKSKEYGYEFWMVIDADMEVGGEIEVVNFPGGLYAVATCKLHGDPKGNVIDVWKKLWEWVQSSAYEWRETHELEKLHNPLGAEKDAVLDLYLPVEAA